mmetsp:Transcript_13900/g.40010  ORF Transcript_13900/g.40010 Transcript_13900/m.40010 type:complete len:235 (-) Transcript_13900:1530-2234(-)
MPRTTHPTRIQDRRLPRVLSTAGRQAYMNGGGTPTISISTHSYRHCCSHTKKALHPGDKTTPQRRKRESKSARDVGRDACLHEHIFPWEDHLHKFPHRPPCQEGGPFANHQRHQNPRTLVQQLICVRECGGDVDELQRPPDALHQGLFDGIEHHQREVHRQDLRLGRQTRQQTDRSSGARAALVEVVEARGLQLAPYRLLGPLWRREHCMQRVGQHVQGGRVLAAEGVEVLLYA